METLDFYAIIVDGFLQVFHGGVDRIAWVEADIGNERRLGRNDVGGRRALHLCEGNGGTHEGIELAAALFTDHIQDGFENFNVGEDNTENKR